MLNGRYAFRFSGFSMSRGEIPCHLVGVGVMDMTPDGRLTGSHHSSSTALVGPGAKQRRAAYRLSGRYWSGRSDIWYASVRFYRWVKRDDVTDTAGDMKGLFRFVAADGYDRLWLISTGGEITSFGLDVDEVISAEALRVAPSRRSRR